MISPSDVMTWIVLFAITIGLVSSRDPFFDELAPNSLRQVHVLLSHGEQAPSPLDTSCLGASAAHWPNSCSELTKEGLRQHDRLGRWFRDRYDNILDRRRNYKQVKVISTDSDRTLSSAQANLAGLYYNEDYQEWPIPDLAWFPFPVHMAPQEQDTLLFVDQSCPAVRHQESKLHEMPRMRRLEARAAPLFPLFTSRLGFNVTSLTDISNVYENLVIQVNHNMNVPNWMKPHLRLMEDVSRFCLKCLACTPELKLLRGGPLISKIGTEMLQKAQSGPSPSFFMYSAHQSVLAVNLQTVRAFNSRHPPFAAAVIYELHELGQENFVVRMLYHNDSSMENAPLPITVSGCGLACPLQEWRSLLAPYVAADHEAACAAQDGPAELKTGQTRVAGTRTAGDANSYSEVSQEKQKNGKLFTVLKQPVHHKALLGHGDVSFEELIPHNSEYGPILVFGVLGFFVVLAAVVCALEVAACTFCRAQHSAYVRI